MRNTGGTYGDVLVITGGGAVVTGFTGYDTNQSVINVKDSASDVSISDCDTSDAATGIQISGTDVTVSECMFHDMTRMINDNAGNCSGAHGGQGVNLYNTIGPVTIANNHGHNLKATSVCYGTDGAFAEIYNAQNVLIEDNMSESGEVFVESNINPTGNTIIGNTISNEAFLTLQQATGMTIRNNTVTNMTYNVYLGSGPPTEFSFNSISGSSRFFWLDVVPPTCSWHDNTYTWTGSGTFGHAGSTNYSTVSSWNAAIESCSGPTATPTVAPPTATPTTGPTPTATSTPSAGQPVVIMAAGDVACVPGNSRTSTNCHQQDTANIINATNPDYVFMLGDAQYETGTQSNFNASYNPTWGTFLGKTWGTAGGSHDFYGGGYFATYFGSRVGTPLQNWYSFDTANGWHIISLNSYCDNNGNCAAQTAWLQADLAAHPNSCTIAMWHEPLYTSGTRHNNETRMDPYFDMLVNAGVEMVLSGHEHNYERIGPIGTSNNSTTSGAVYFVVGTGGKSLETQAPSMEPLSRSYQANTFGVLKLTLYSDHAEFVFVPEAGKTFTDSGSIPCH